nr:hypothetical protein [Tanacetum cinerariifolium]
MVTSRRKFNARRNATLIGATDTVDQPMGIKVIAKVEIVKLNRGLKEFNYDQLYACLKQHETHANENKMMLDRYNQQAIDPLALVSSVSPPQDRRDCQGVKELVFGVLLVWSVVGLGKTVNSVQTSGSGISNLLAVGTTFTGSGNLYCQWELSPGSGNALYILFPTLIAKFLILDIPIDCDAPIVVGWGFLRMIGGIVNTLESLFLTFDGFCHQTFRAVRSDVMRNTESDSDDEEEYEIKRNKFRAPIYGLKPAPYLNCNDPTEQSLALQIVTNPFWKISV